MDWKPVGAHSNDLEGCMVAVHRESGRVEIVAAIEHADINAGRLSPDGVHLTTSRDRENEAYLWYALAPLYHPADDFTLWNRFTYMAPDGSIGMSPF